jgi:hypothetical protein
MMMTPITKLSEVKENYNDYFQKMLPIILTQIDQRNLTHHLSSRQTLVEYLSSRIKRHRYIPLGLSDLSNFESVWDYISGKQNTIENSKDEEDDNE